MDCVKLTLLGTQRTADTANLAGCLDSRSTIVGAALYQMFCLYGTRSIRCFGQAATQAPHATHFSLSTTATPSTTWIASNLHAFTQVPKPGYSRKNMPSHRHPVQRMPSHSPRYHGTRIVLLSCRRYLYINESYLFSEEPASTPMIAAIFSPTGAPPTGQA